MNFEDMIRAEYQHAIEEDGSECGSRHTITELTGFVESHLNSAKDADADNDPGATREALAMAGGMVLYALRSHGRKWHYAEPLTADQTKVAELETQLAHEKRQEQGYQDAIGDLQMQVFERDERIVNLETCYNVARETRETWEQRAAAAEATLASIQESLEPIGDFAGKDTPIDQRIAQLVERSFREHANLYAMQQAALEFMGKYDVSDDGWWDSDLVDYVNAACQGIEKHYDRKLKELTEDAAKLPSVRSELERVSDNLLAVHRECERRGYGADDKRPAVEKVREIIDYADELEQLVVRLGERIKELESKRELTLEETVEPERHDLGLIVEDWQRIKAHLVNGGHPAVGSCLASTIEKLIEHSIELQEVHRLKAEEPAEEEAGSTIARRLDLLADLENEIANFYALRATEDFADPDDRCWDLEHATKHVRRWQEVVEEQDREAGR